MEGLSELLSKDDFIVGPSINVISLKRLNVNKYVFKSDDVFGIKSRYIIFPLYIKNIRINGEIMDEGLNIVIVDIIGGIMERFNMYIPSYSESSLNDEIFKYITEIIQRYNTNFNPSSLYPPLQTSDKKYTLRQILYYMDMRLSNIQIDRNTVIDSFIQTASLSTLDTYYNNLLNVLLIPKMEYILINYLYQIE